MDEVSKTYKFGTLIDANYGTFKVDYFKFQVDGFSIQKKILRKLS
jgi:hypothetical protein